MSASDLSTLTGWAIFGATFGGYMAFVWWLLIVFVVTERVRLRRLDRQYRHHGVRRRGGAT